MGACGLSPSTFFVPDVVIVCTGQLYFLDQRRLVAEGPMLVHCVLPSTTCWNPENPSTLKPVQHGAPRGLDCMVHKCPCVCCMVEEARQGRITKTRLMIPVAGTLHLRL